MFNGLRRAIELVTIIPVGARYSEDDRSGVAGWLPMVGLGLGGVMYVAVHALFYVGWYGAGPLIVAAILVAFSALITRMLHFDGLGDVADAWWGGHTVERRLEIMSDSALGSFGSTAISIVVVTQVVSIGNIVGSFHQLPLLLVAPMARFAATFAAWLGTPARPGGLGRSVMGRPRVGELAAAVSVLLFCSGAAWVALGVWGAGFVIIGLALALAVPHLMAQRVGGVTGDVMGASVLVVETMLYVIAAVGMEWLW